MAELRPFKTYTGVQKRSASAQKWAWHCHGKNGPDKNGPAGPILDEKMVWPDQYWPTKYGPAGPILVTKSGPA